MTRIQWLVNDCFCCWNLGIQEMDTWQCKTQHTVVSYKVGLASVPLHDFMTSDDTIFGRYSFDAKLFTKEYSHSEDMNYTPDRINYYKS